MTSNTQRMLDAIGSAGKVTLKELKRQGVMVHAALIEMIGQGIKVRSSFSPVEQSCVYWIGALLQLSQNHGRPITEMSPRESKAFADLIGNGQWYSTQQISEILGVTKDRATKYIRCIREGRIGDGVKVTSQKLNQRSYVFRFDLAEAV